MRGKAEGPLWRRQLIVLAGAAAGAVVVIVCLANTTDALRWVSPPRDEPAARLAFAARWLLLPGVSLLAGVVAVSSRRWWSAPAIMGAPATGDEGLEIDRRYIQNTMEQVTLASIAWLGLAVQLPVRRLDLIPAAGILFLAGRAAFWLGYRIHPLARAFGMVLTALPTVIAYGWLAGRLFEAEGQA